ncbi:MAG: FtsW/RodA/SpoVE family cell cycle protein [Candidatus Kapaibacteriota bacterium]
MFVVVLVLWFFSISAVYSSSAFYSEFRFGSYDIFFWNHLRNIAISFALMLIFSFVDFKIWVKIANYLLYLSIFLLILVLVISIPIKGATRWLDLGFANFQPSELAKFSLILYISRIIAERYDLKDDFPLVPLPIFVWTMIVCFLIALQPNFSTALILFLIVSLLVFVSKLKFKYIFRFSLFLLVLGTFYGVSESYRLNRLLGYYEFLTSDSQSFLTYQTNQALIAIGNGGLLGLGPGKTQQSKLFLPESYGDYIFSIIGEEYGFIGISFVLLLLFLLLYRLYRIAINCEDLFAFVFVSGVVITIGSYTIINALVNLGFLPTTGLPMPFISYGGSAMMIYATSIGIIQNIYSNIAKEECEK